jgi:two-component system cell cycle sensor histidine kinase/response regulator CckA
VVLVVEDDAAIRAIARRALVRAGYHVHDAGSAEEALRVQRALTHGVELLVSDVILPGRNGWDLSRELVTRLPGLRVLFMSGYAAEHSGESLLPAGVPFLAKPFTPGELLERVGAALDAGARAQGAAAASAAKRSA